MSILSSRALAVGVLSLVAVHAARAQLERGDHVRLLHRADTNVVNVGVLDTVTADSIIMRDDSSHATTAVARDSIRVVERETVVGHRALRGAGIGLVAGAVAGVTVGANATHCSGDGECPQIEGVVPILGMLGGLVGSLTGAVIGAFFTHEEWLPVGLPPRG